MLQQRSLLLHCGRSVHPQRRLSCRKMRVTTRFVLREASRSLFRYRQQRHILAKAAIGKTSTSGGDGVDGPGDGAGDGGEGGDEGDSGKSKSFTLWKGWEDRVLCDPAFPSKVLIEQIIGVGAAVVGDMSSRPKWGLHELDFVFATLIVGSIVNFALMYCLAATPATTGPAQGSILQKLFSEQTLKSLGAPGGHMFEKGYSIGARMTNLAYKGFLFGIIGICSGLIGTALSNGLILMRQRMDPSFQPQNEAPNVGMNALAWGTHMGISANTRYQILYGLDTIMTPALGRTWFLVYSAIIRTLNNVFGGTSFVFFARLYGVQKVNEAGFEASK